MENWKKLAAARQSMADYGRGPLEQLLASTPASPLVLGALLRKLAGDYETAVAAGDIHRARGVAWATITCGLLGASNLCLCQIPAIGQA